MASFLDSEVTEEVLAIMEVLSAHRYCRPKITGSGALASILKILDSQMRALKEKALKILCNLSLDMDIRSHIIALQCIPKLVSLFKDSKLAGNCLVILRNLCDVEEARASIAETDRCIGSITEVLETDSHEDQEHAVFILLSLCSQRVEYCELVMDEGVIPALVSISINGSEKAMVGAQELLRLLRDVRHDDDDEQVCADSDHHANMESRNQPIERKPSKASKFFGRLTIGKKKK